MYAAKIHFKIRNEKLAEQLWGRDDEGRTWEYIYFIKEGKYIELAYRPQILRKPNGEPYKKNHIVRRAVLLNTYNSEAVKRYVEESEGESLDENRVDVV